MAAKWFLIACVVAVIWAADMAPTASSSHHGHAHAPAPSADCQALVLTLIDCLPFVSNDSTQTKPQGTCCPSLKTVLSTAPHCLCDSFKNSGQLGIAINFTKAATLPAACKLSSPSLSNCGLSPSPAPAPAPGSSPSSSAAANGSPGGAPSSSSSPGNAASAFVPISAGSFIICLLVAVSLIPF